MKISIKKILLLTIFLFSVTNIKPSEASGQRNYDAPQGTLNNHNVVILGDSQTVGPFGRSLGRQILDRSAHSYIRIGRQGWGVASWWSSRSHISRIIRNHQPTLLLVGLGGNDWSRSANEEGYEVLIRQFWQYLNREMNRNREKHARKLRIIWISPATVVGRRATELQPGRRRASRIIRTVVGENNYVNSSDITGNFGRTPDGLHFTPEGGENWAQSIVPRIESCL